MFGKFTRMLFVPRESAERPNAALLQRGSTQQTALQTSCARWRGARGSAFK